jgi:hypothetical protein
VSAVGWTPWLDSRPCEIGLLKVRVHDPGEAIPRSARPPRPCPGRSRGAGSPRAGQPDVDIAIGARPRACGLNARRGAVSRHEKFETLPLQRSKPFGVEPRGGACRRGSTRPRGRCGRSARPAGAKTSASTHPLVPVFRRLAIPFILKSAERGTAHRR